MKPCRYAGSEQPRMLKTHLRDCETSGCEGCEPCTERHCSTCGIRHVEALTCPTCVGNVREDLLTIVELSTHLLTEAVHRGVNSEAAMLDGPVADGVVAMYRRACRCNPAWSCPDLQPRIGPTCKTKCLHSSCRWLTGWSRRCPAHVAWEADNRDEAHPLYVLGTWDMLVTEHYGHQRTQRVTIDGAVVYLGANLTDLAQDRDFAFEELAREVRQCRGHLEDVLHDGERDERGAPCPACIEEHEHGPALVKKHDDADPSGASDKWHCPAVRHHVWSEADYWLRIGTKYLSSASALTASQMAMTYRVPEGTVRRWASGNAPTVRIHGKDDAGRQLYDVSDVLAMRDSSGIVSA